jgi:uncharacterized membrane protein
MLDRRGDANMTDVTKTIDVNVPVRAAYNQWTQFEDFPKFMDGVESVTQLDAQHLHWKARIVGRDEDWNAEIQEQIPDQLISWASTTGKRNAGKVRFEPLDGQRTRVELEMSYDPEGFVENVGEMLGAVTRQVSADLARFKEYVEARGSAPEGWRGAIEGGEVEPRPTHRIDEQTHTGEANRLQPGMTGLEAAEGMPRTDYGQERKMRDPDFAPPQFMPDNTYGEPGTGNFGSEAVSEAPAAGGGTNDIRGGTGMAVGPNRGGVASQNLGGGAGGVGGSTTVQPSLGSALEHSHIGDEDPGGPGDLTGGMGGVPSTSSDEGAYNAEAIAEQERESGTPADRGNVDRSAPRPTPDRPPAPEGTNQTQAPREQLG